MDLIRSLNQFKTEKEAIQRELDEVQHELQRHKEGTNAEAELESARKNYSIMKEAYSKMRTEHLELLRSVSIIDNFSSSIQTFYHYFMRFFRLGVFFKYNHKTNKLFLLSLNVERRFGKTGEQF